MELDARNNLALAEVIFLESSRAAYATKTTLATASGFSVSEHLKIVLEHVDQLV